MKMSYSTTRTDIFAIFNIVMFFNLVSLLPKTFAEKELSLRRNKHQGLNNHVSISTQKEHRERIMKKSKLVKEVIQGLGEATISSLIEAVSGSSGSSGSSDTFALPSTSSCFEDLGYASAKYLPTVSSDMVGEACRFENIYEYIKFADVKCDFQQLESFISSFKSSCEDNRFQMILSNVYIYPGTNNFNAFSTSGEVYSISSIKENNVPVCLPKSCSYTEASTIMDTVEITVANTNGYQSVTYLMQNYPIYPTISNTEETMPNNSNSEGELATWLTPLLIVVGAVWIIWYGYKNDKFGAWKRSSLEYLKHFWDYLKFRLIVSY
jgi:hypothetical protein